MPKSAARPKDREHRVGTSRGHAGVIDGRRPERPHAYVVEEGQPAYVLVPVEEYEQLIKADMVETAIDRLEHTPESAWIDADDLRARLAADRIVEARKKAGLTQQQLARKLGIPQSQVSRIERHPDHTTVRTLKKLARALNVDVARLL